MTPVRPEKNRSRLYPFAIGAVLLVVLVIVYLITREFSKTAQIFNPPTAPPVTTAPPETPSPPTSPPEPPADPAPVVQAEPQPVQPEPQPQVPVEALRIDLEAKERTWIKVYADWKTGNPWEDLETGMTRHF